MGNQENKEPGKGRIIVDAATQADVLRIIVDMAGKTEKILIKPRPPSHLWGMWINTQKGRVRALNRDFCLGFEMAEPGHAYPAYSVMILASGKEGFSNSRKAARLAAIHAGILCVRQLSVRKVVVVGDCLKLVFEGVRTGLAEECRRLGSEEGKSLRTTLTIIVSCGEEYHYFYIGNDCGFVYRPSKAELINFTISRGTAGYLSPLEECEPAFGCMKKERGDMLLLGTASTIAHFDPRSPRKILKKVFREKGDLRRVVEKALSDLFMVSNDNSTVGLMFNGKPNLPRDFWERKEESIRMIAFDGTAEEAEHPPPDT